MPVSIRDVCIPGGWTDKSITLAGQAYSILAPANPDEFLEHLDGQNLPPHIADPYWARLWPTALTMAELVAREKWPAGQQALEIGCGIGIVGLAALLRDLHVTFSDYIPLAVELACHNARQNGLSKCTGQVFDWRSPAKQQYSVILASDVLYDPKLHSHVLSLLGSALADNGTCWIGDPGRYHCEAFVQMAVERGYHVSIRNQHGRDESRIAVGEFCLFVLQRSKEQAGRT